MNELFLSIFLTAGQVIIVLLAVDFASGVLHWLEDSYGKPSWPFLGRHVIQPNIQHHFKPRAFTKTNFWNRNSGTIVVSGVLMGVVLLLGLYHWMWALACGVGAISNEIHCWAHRSPKENGRFITALQRMFLIQTPKAHARHHTNPKNKSYCTVGNLLNPILDRFKLFERAERGIFNLTGVRRREDQSVKRRVKRIPVCRCLAGEECKDCPREVGKPHTPALR